MKLPFNTMQLTRNQTLATSNRESIMKAALELFTEYGFNATAVPLVAKRAGVSPGTIYRYFESKEALVNELYQQWQLTLYDYLRADYKEEDSHREQFRALFQGLVRFWRENPVAFSFLEINHHPYLNDRSLCLYDKMMAYIAEYLRKTEAAGTTRSMPPDAIVALVLGGFTCLVKIHERGRFELTEEVLLQVEDSCWEAIRR